MQRCDLKIGIYLVTHHNFVYVSSWSRKLRQALALSPKWRRKMLERTVIHRAGPRASVYVYVYVEHTSEEKGTLMQRVCSYTCGRELSLRRKIELQECNLHRGIDSTALTRRWSKLCGTLLSRVLNASVPPLKIPKPKYANPSRRMWSSIQTCSRRILTWRTSCGF